MLTPKTPLIESSVINEKSVIPYTFNLLTWNIHKENNKKEFPLLIQELRKTYSIDVLLLQEARFSKTLLSIAGLPYIAAANLSFPRFYSGVVTATDAYPFYSDYIMTTAREVFFRTRKTSLITVYRFKDKLPLMIVNLHAINLKSLSWYQLEFSRLHDRIRQHKGPMILAGDFNCWGKHRKTIMNTFAMSLNLEHVRPKSARYIKKWLGHHLDKIYFRDLMLVDIQAVNCKGISDHNPIIARFTRINKNTGL